LLFFLQNPKILRKGQINLHFFGVFLRFLFHFWQKCGKMQENRPKIAVVAVEEEGCRPLNRIRFPRTDDF